MARSLRNRPAAPAARSANRGGFSLPELLVVVAMIGLAVLVAVPLVAHQVRMARIRGAAGRFAGDLAAVRMIAVALRQTVSVEVEPDPVNAYSFTDVQGRLRRVSMPEGVRIVSCTSPVSFRPNGSVPGGATAVFEARLPDGLVERWTVWTNAIGSTKTTHARVP